MLKNIDLNERSGLNSIFQRLLKTNCILKQFSGVFLFCTHKLENIKSERKYISSYTRLFAYLTRYFLYILKYFPTYLLISQYFPIHPRTSCISRISLQISQNLEYLIHLLPLGVNRLPKSYSPISPETKYNTLYPHTSLYVFTIIPSTY